MNKLPKSLRTEYRYQLWGRTIFWLAAVSVLAVGLIFQAGLSNAHSAAERLTTTTGQAQENGLTLDNAMSQPVGTVTENSQSFIDNPLRYDYEAAYNASQALETPYAVGTGLEMASLLVFPWLFFIYGCFVAVMEVRQKLLKQRVTIEGARNVVIAKGLSVLLSAAAVVVLCSLLSLVLSGALRAWAELPPDEAMTYAVPEGITGAVPQMLFALATCSFFGLLGLFTGLATRSFFIPSLAAVAFLMVAPFVGAWDPRNIMISAAGGVFNFWGGFSPRAAFPVDATQGVTLYAAALALIIAAAVVVWNRRSKFA